MNNTATTVNVCVPMSVMGKTGLSHGARLLYGLIWTMMAAEHRSTMEIKSADLSGPLTVSGRQLGRYVNELVAAGYIDMTVRPWGKPNVYSLLNVERK